jgi:hypothetical protein
VIGMVRRCLYLLELAPLRGDGNDFYDGLE